MKKFLVLFFAIFWVNHLLYASEWMLRGVTPSQLTQSGYTLHSVVVNHNEKRETFYTFTKDESIVTCKVRMGDTPMDGTLTKFFCYNITQ